MTSEFTRRGVLVATAASLAGCEKTIDLQEVCIETSPSSVNGPITSTTRTVDLPGSLAELWVASTRSNLPTPEATPALGVTLTEGILLAGAGDTATTDTVRTNVATVLVGDNAIEIGNPGCFPAVAVTHREGLLIDLRVNDIREDTPLLGNLKRAEAANSITALPSTQVRSVAGTRAGGLVLSGSV